MFDSAAFIKVLQNMVLKQLASISLSQKEKKRLFLELERLSDQVDLLIKQKTGYPPTFLAMIEHIIHRFEGPRSNEKFDPGRATMFGLSERHHPEVRKEIINGTLTKDRAIKIYFDKYYSTIYGIDRIHPAVAFIVLDGRIHGSRESIRDMQTWLSRKSGKSIIADGIFGPKTYNEIKDLTSDELKQMLAYLDQRAFESAANAARRVLDLQAREGLPSYDYTNGFKNRLSKRYSFANTLISEDIQYV